MSPPKLKLFSLKPSSPGISMHSRFVAVNSPGWNGRKNKLYPHFQCARNPIARTIQIRISYPCCEVAANPAQIKTNPICSASQTPGDRNARRSFCLFSEAAQLAKLKAARVTLQPRIQSEFAATLAQLIMTPRPNSLVQAKRCSFQTSASLW